MQVDIFYGVAVEARGEFVHSVTKNFNTNIHDQRIGVKINKLFRHLDTTYIPHAETTNKKKEKDFTLHLNTYQTRASLRG